MTYHIRKPDYECPQCHSTFIPFRDNIPCPNCKINTNEPEYYDFIKELAGSMKVHKLEFGRFTPGAWFSNSFVAYIQMLCFELYDRLEVVHPKDEREWLVYTISGIKFEDRYLEKHVRDIMLAVYDPYIEEERFTQSRNPLVRWLKKKMKNQKRPEPVRTDRPKKEYSQEMPAALLSDLEHEAAVAAGMRATIEIPEEYSDWYRESVEITQGSKGVLYVYKEEAYENLLEKMADTMRSAGMVDDKRRSLKDFIRASTRTYSAEITDEGKLYIPEALQPHFTDLSGDMKITEDHGRLVLTITP